MLFESIPLHYPEGYFRQSLDESGWQRESYRATAWDRTPAELVLDDAGAPVTVPVPLGAHEIHVRIWRLHIGRSILYLLDTDDARNSDADRDIAGRLYTGDSPTRIR